VLLRLKMQKEKSWSQMRMDYDYLLGMPIWSLTKEKIAKLNEQAAD